MEKKEKDTEENIRREESVTAGLIVCMIFVRNVAMLFRLEGAQDVVLESQGK